MPALGSSRAAALAQQFEAGTAGSSLLHPRNDDCSAARTMLGTEVSLYTEAIGLRKRRWGTGHEFDGRRVECLAISSNPRLTFSFIN